VSTALIPHGSTENWACVDESYLNPDGDTTYVKTTSTTNVSDFYEVQGHTDETESINYVQVFARARSVDYNVDPSSIFKICIQVEDSGYYTTYKSNSKDITKTYSLKRETWATNPSTDTAWTWDEIDALRIGVECNSSYITGYETDIDLYPDGDSDVNLTPAGSTENWACVADTNTSLRVQTASDNFVTDKYNIENTLESGVISKITIFAYASAINGSHGYFKLGVKSGSTEDYADQHLVRSAGEWISDTWTTNPDTSSAWTFSDINSMLGLLQVKDTDYPSTYYARCHIYKIKVYYVKNVVPEVRLTQCYMKVNYDPSAISVTLTQPKKIRFINTRKIEHFNFDDGEYELEDTGCSGKTLVISGTQITSAPAYMETLRTMRDNGDKVTVAGLDDSNLNGDYYIRSFNRRQHIGGVAVNFDWTLTLERIS
jgi:hypothetical protein